MCTHHEIDASCRRNEPTHKTPMSLSVGFVLSGMTAGATVIENYTQFSKRNLDVQLIILSSCLVASCVNT